MNVKAYMGAAAVGAALALGSAGSAGAAVYDFTSGVAPIDGKSTSSIDMGTYTIDGWWSYASNTDPANRTARALNFVEKLTDSGVCAADGLLACKRDGAGVGDDEISETATYYEGITVTFDTVQTITGLIFLDLFVSPDDADIKEQAQVVFDEGTANESSAVFTAAETKDGVNIGYLNAAFGPVKATTLTFILAPLTNDDRGVGDYAVAGIVTPLPAAVWFMVTALGGLFGTRWLRGARTA
ncbi:hypothetical protein [Roseospira navarrensis]|uniref:VPLPA-CTERM sorting domain-containing protein n=1 Tax=Roseospira navarrensis TaxID=140058 RepID=A0A7X2D418_9PROT|nr:hypothetical protein [Roseospira navarrensis]MQX37386.1 hypothetical protein [Roseospira navarrensis]